MERVLSQPLTEELTETVGAYRQSIGSAYVHPLMNYVFSQARTESTSTDSREDPASGQAPEALGPSAVPDDVHCRGTDPTITRFPGPTPSPYRFELLQQWEGTVTDVGEEEFEARLTDLTDPRRPDESAVFGKEEVSDGDLSLLTKGAVFRWSVGYKTRRGQKERVSNISFLRLPAWSAKSVAAVEQAASLLESAFPPSNSP